MRKFSRWMPPVSKPPSTFFELLGGFGLLGALVAAVIAWPLPMGGILAVLLVGTLVMIPVDNRYFQRLASQRVGEDIGTFARAFDRRNEPFDPWVVRATWDALQVYVRYPGGRLPLRP